MSEVKDDPREVLALLNSLGFIGITASQLKAFMKDLKTYRKIKEHEKQQRKEEIKARIINKQQAVIKDAQEHHDRDYSSNSAVSSELLNSFNDESLVKVRIRCISKEDEQKKTDEEKQKHIKVTAARSNDKSSRTKYNKENVAQVEESDKIHYKHYDKFPSGRQPRSENKQNASQLAKNSHQERCKSNLRIEEQVKSVTSVHDHLANDISSDISRSQSKSAMSEPYGHMRAQSTLSTRSSVNFAQKSFIRPWKLQAKMQRNVTNKRCDPVALYQKYQEEWKQMSFPGEAKHSKIRWAVREKMLGVDPQPVPLPKKSASMPILKKK